MNTAINSSYYLVIMYMKLSNDKINIPYLPKMAEQIMIKFLIGNDYISKKKLNFENARATSS